MISVEDNQNRVAKTCPQCSLLPLAIGEIMAEAATTGQLTLTDRYGLMAAILSEVLEDEDRAAIDRLLRAVLRGKLKITHQLTATSSRGHSSSQGSH